MQYGLDNEDLALEKYKKQVPAAQVRKCGLFISTENGELAASPDAISTINGEKRVVEIKSLSASRHMTPWEAVKFKQKQNSFALHEVTVPCKGSKKMITHIRLKKTHRYYNQVQMQMAITGAKMCHFVVFTNKNCNVLIVPVPFNQTFWLTMKDKLLDYHSSCIVPALVQNLVHSKKNVDQ